MTLTKITRNFQITLPKYIREMKQLREGDNLAITLENNEIKITKCNTLRREGPFGAWKERAETGQEYQTRIRKGWKKRYMRETR